MNLAVSAEQGRCAGGAPAALPRALLSRGCCTFVATDAPVVIVEGMLRRTFLSAAAGSLLADAHPIIDTHTHFYDPSRPEGVPWPGRNEKVLYRTVLPEEFVKMTGPLGITGTIVIEASPWLEDNQWVLDLAARNPIIVGVVGHLEPGTNDFPKHLERFAKSNLFRGIRLSRFDTANPRFQADLRLVAEAGLQIDVLGGPPMLPELVRLADNAPELRIVIDHLPFDPPSDPGAAAAFRSALRELGRRPKVYAKISGVLRRQGRTPAGYRSALEELLELFGEDRVIYGSNWPVSDLIAPYPDVLRVVREFFTARGSEAYDKYFSKNSQAAYRWVRRA